MKRTRGISPGLVVAVLLVLAAWPAIPRAASVSATSLLAIRWNAALSREEFGALNTTTGAFTFRGTIGDLQTWSGQSLVEGSTLYVLGNGALPGNLYILDVNSGGLINTVNLGSTYTYFLGGLDQGGSLIAIRWNAALAREEFGALNTATGAFSFRGTIGDLQTWSGQSLVDGGTLYVLGNGALPGNLYILDVNSGGLINTVNLGSTYTYFLGGLDQGGSLIAIRSNAALAREEFGALNTATGAFSFRGTIGDLQTWSGQSLVDGGTLYVLGNGALPGNLYILDVSSGGLIDTVNVGSTYVYYLPKRASPRQDLAVDFGAVYGTWILTGNGWSLLHSLSPEAMVRGDVDGNGSDDLVLDFGAPYGVWLWMNHATWIQLHTLSPSLMVTGDLDHNARDEVILDFPGFGLWIWWNHTDWTQLHSLEASHLAAGNLDGLLGDELIVDFPGFGLWAWTNNSAWTQLHALSASTLLTADLDGSGSDDVVINFPGQGIWIWRNNTMWIQLIPVVNAAHLAAGDLDGNGRADLVIDFGAPYGLWTFRNDTTWVALHPLAAESLVLVDRDGTGKDEVVIGFGPPYGLWQYANDTTWTKLHPVSPEAMVGARLH